MRGAASSSASGRPSNRRQISATAAPLSRVSAKSGLTACARRRNRSTAGFAASAWTDNRCVTSGAGNGATRNSCSLRSRRAARLVMSTFS